MISKDLIGGVSHEDRKLLLLRTHNEEARCYNIEGDDEEREGLRASYPDAVHLRGIRGSISAHNEDMGEAENGRRVITGGEDQWPS